MTKRSTAPIYGWLLALLIPIFAIQVALTTPIEEHAFDAAAFHIWRGVVFSQARAEGILYPRWVAPINAGLGGPLFNFYSPLAYYLMDGLHWLGLPHPLGWRVLVALALFAASTGMFALGLALFRRVDFALVAAACFTYSPFLLRDFFERGAPQGIAIALYPALLWSLFRLVERPSGAKVALAAMFWAVIVLMHNLSAALLLPIVGLFGLYLMLKNGWRALWLIALVLILGVSLSAFHVLSFLADSKYVQLNAASQDPTVQPALNPVALNDLLAWPAIFDTGIDNNATGSSIGLLHVAIVVAGPGIAIVLWRRKHIAEAVLVGGGSLWALAMIWLHLDNATPFWLAFPGLNILQFRVRLLNTFGLIAAIGIGYLLEQIPSRVWRSGLIAGLIAIFIVMQIPSLYPQLLHRYADFPTAPTVDDARAWAVRNGVPGLTLTTTKELLPVWRDLAYFSDEEVARIAAAPIENLPNGARILESDRHSEQWHLRLESPVPFEAVLHTLYFPGWVATVNGQSQPLTPVPNTGYTKISLPAGTVTLDLRYEGTSTQHAGDLISLAAVIVIIILSIAWRNKDIPLSSEIIRLKPRWWIPVGVVALLILKAVWIDPNTTLFRHASTCAAVQSAGVQSAVQFGDITLCGYSVSGPVLRPGDPFRMTLYWQLDQAAQSPSYSFVHLLGSAFNPATNNPLWGQQDKQNPGTLPTTLWLPGKLYQDTYDFRLPADTPSGDYQIEIGWTTPASKRIAPKIVNASPTQSVSDLDALLVSGITVR